MEFNQAVADELAQVMSSIPEAKAGKMFGMPGYKVNGKVALGVYEDHVVAKVGLERAKTLIGKPGVQACEMRGRVWKDWVAISGDLQSQRALLEEAVHYVAENS